jgi:hypothetical protein
MQEAITFFQIEEEKRKRTGGQAVAIGRAKKIEAPKEQGLVTPPKAKALPGTPVPPVHNTGIEIKMEDPSDGLDAEDSEFEAY